jgi:regulator of protease activity HflC (stomatin/prohibitin superfamily)
MADSDKTGPPTDEPKPARGAGPATLPPRPADEPKADLKVSWRGIVESNDKKPVKPPKRGGAVSRLFSTIFVSLGIIRARREDGTLAPRPWKRMAVIYGGLILVLVVVSMVHTVPSGSVAVPVTFGAAGEPLDPGLHITAPWPITTVYEMSTRTENYTMAKRDTEGDQPGDDSVTVLGRDGAEASVDATVLYRVPANNATEVYTNVGLDYLTKVIRPSARNCIRTSFTQYDLVTASTNSWNDVSKSITDCMRDKMEPRGIRLQDFQLREVGLGKQVQDAINLKVAAQQEAERQQFELATSEQKAEIQRVEAQATADYQQILNCGATVRSVERDGKQVQALVPNTGNDCRSNQLTNEFLQYQYIQALKALATSDNNSTVVLPGGGQQITPLINIPQAPTPTTAPAPGR